MTDTMLLGVLRMPMDDPDPLTLHQFVSRARQAADEIDRLHTELANAKASGIHNCHANCTRSGCVNARLRDALARVEVIMWHHSSEFPELREVVRAALKAAQ